MSKQRPGTGPTRAFNFDPRTDELLTTQAHRDHITMTEAIRRALETRETMLQLAAPPARLAIVGDPATELGTGVTELRLLGHL
jgi:hypothetical protein